MPRHAPPFPWHAAEHTDGLIPIRDARDHDVLYVPVDADPADDSLTTERTVAVIEAWSKLMIDYRDMEDAGIRATIRRIAALAITAVSTAGITLGLAAVLSC